MHGHDYDQARASVRPLLLLSVPIALLGLCASVAGLLSEFAYVQETRQWAAQAVGQDAVNLVAFSALLLLALAAARGSLEAYLAWLGILVYSTYSYVLYAGFVHFSPLFLVYVAVLGLSAYALIGGLGILDPVRVREAFGPGAPVRLVAGFLLVLGFLFYLLELSVVIAAMLGGEPPQSAVDAGLPVNPVHVLDLALLLPGMIIAGILLRRRHGLGYCLGVLLLTHLGILGLAVIAMIVAMESSGLSVSWVMATVFGCTTVLSFSVLTRFLAGVRADASLFAVLRDSGESGEH